MCICPFAYGGPSCKTNFSLPARDSLSFLYKFSFFQIFKISGSLLGKFAFIKNEVFGRLIFSLFIMLTLFLNLFLQKLHRFSFVSLI